MMYNDYIALFQQAVSNLKGRAFFGHGTLEEMNSLSNDQYPLVWLVTPLQVTNQYAGSSADFFSEGYNVRLRVVTSASLVTDENKARVMYNENKILADAIVQQIRDTEDLEIQNYNLSQLFKVQDDVHIGWEASFTLISYLEPDECCSLAFPLVINSPDDCFAKVEDLCDTDIEDKQIGDVLTWDGTAWINSPGPIDQSVTYAELFALYEASNFVTGRRYTFDFETIHTKPNSGGVVHVGPTERLTVTAKNNSELEIEATSEQYPEDIIWYDITGAAIAEVATAAGHKGAIYFRKDTDHNVDARNDFRAVEYLRWSLDLTFMGGNAINHCMWNNSITGMGVSDRPASVRTTLTLTAQSLLPYDDTPLLDVNGGITGTTLVSGGSTSVLGGALSGLYSVAPTVSATIGTGFTATANLAPTGGVKTITPVTGGDGYSEDTLLIVSGPWTRPPVIKAILLNGQIIGGDILDCGEGGSGTRTVTASGTTGAGFTGTVTLGYLVASITVNTPGINHTADTVINLVGDGFGAAASILTNPAGYKSVKTFGEGLNAVYDVSIPPQYVPGTQVLTLNNFTFDATFAGVNCANVKIKTQAINSSFINSTSGYTSINTSNVIYIAGFSNQLGFDQSIDNFQLSIFLNVFTRAKLPSMIRSAAYKAASNAVSQTFRNMVGIGSNISDLVFRRGTFCNNNDGPGMVINCSRTTFEGNCRFLNMDVSVFNNLGNIYVKDAPGIINRQFSNYAASYNIEDSETTIVIERLHEGKQSMARAASGGFISKIQLKACKVGGSPTGATINRIGEIHANSSDYIGEKEFWGQDGITFTFDNNDVDIGIILPGAASILVASSKQYIALKFDQVLRRWLFCRSNV